MAEKSYPFNYDPALGNEYDQEEFSAMLNHGFLDGISYKRYGETSLKATVPNYGTVNVAPGLLRGQGYFYENNAILTLPIPAHTTGKARTDRVVVRLNTAAGSVGIHSVIKTGTSGSANPPALTRSGTIYEWSLAQIKYNASSTTLTVVDEREDMTVCGTFMPEQAYPGTIHPGKGVNAEVCNTTLGGFWGNVNSADGDYSCARGRLAGAFGDYSFAEGFGISAHGDYSHVGGTNAQAHEAAICAFVHGEGLIANAPYQVLFGKHAKLDANVAFAIGNGASSVNRSNLFAVASNGDIHSGGDIHNEGDIHSGGDIYIGEQKVLTKGVKSLWTGTLLCDGSESAKLIFPISADVNPLNYTLLHFRFATYAGVITVFPGGMGGYTFLRGSCDYPQNATTHYKHNLSASVRLGGGQVFLENILAHRIASLSTGTPSNLTLIEIRGQLPFENIWG